MTSEASPAPTRRPLTAPTAGDICDVHDIERLVRSFYRDVAADPVLGPVFARAGTDWAHHIPRLVTFWSWQLLGHARYDGQPLRAHEHAHATTPFTDAHYRRWLELFTETIDAGWAGPTAELAKHRAAKIATAMRRHLARRSA